jgi:SAM-dependent methyltransferase
MANSPGAGFFARKWRRLIQYYGPARLKQEQWDREFKQGRWDYLTDTANDPVYRILEKYARGGSLLDLGCGLGNTPNEMAAGLYERYMGIDISQEAVEMARKRTEENGRAHNTRFAQSDISAYVPDAKYNVILFRESAFYMPATTLKTELHRYAAFLDDAGVFIVRMSGAIKAARTIERMIEENFRVVEKQKIESLPATILVFR